MQSALLEKKPTHSQQLMHVDLQYFCLYFFYKASIIYNRLFWKEIGIKRSNQGME